MNARRERRRAPAAGRLSPVGGARALPARPKTTLPSGAVRLLPDDDGPRPVARSTALGAVAPVVRVLHARLHVVLERAHGGPVPVAAHQLRDVPRLGPEQPAPVLLSQTWSLRYLNRGSPVAVFVTRAHAA